MRETPARSRVELDDDAPLLDLDRVGRDGQDGRERERATAADVDPGTVARTDGDPGLGVQLALGERAVVVRAAVLDRVQLAAEVVDPDLERAVARDPPRPLRQLGERADVEPAPQRCPSIAGSSCRSQ